MIPTKGCFILLLAMVAASAQALTWESSVHEVTVDGNQESVTTTFRFRNAGGKPVRIISLRPSCDCLSANTKPPNEVIAQGESGELRVEFALGGRAGRQEKTITVTTDDAPNAPTVLRLIVDIPEPVAISPKFIFWRVGEPAAEQAIEITLADPEKAKLGEVLCPEAAFTARLEPGSSPNKFRVLIRPAGTAKPVQAPIRLSAVVDGQPRVYVLYAAVK